MSGNGLWRCLSILLGLEAYLRIESHSVAADLETSLEQSTFDLISEDGPVRVWDFLSPEQLQVGTWTDFFDKAAHCIRLFAVASSFPSLPTAFISLVETKTSPNPE